MEGNLLLNALLCLSLHCKAMMIKQLTWTPFLAECSFHTAINLTGCDQFKMSKVYATGWLFAIETYPYLHLISLICQMEKYESSVLVAATLTH